MLASKSLRFTGHLKTSVPPSTTYSRSSTSSWKNREGFQLLIRLFFFFFERPGSPHHLGDPILLLWQLSMHAWKTGKDMKRSGAHERLEKSHVTESKLFDVLQIKLRRPLPSLTLSASDSRTFVKKFGIPGSWSPTVRQHVSHRRSPTTGHLASHVVWSFSWI